MTFDIQTLYVPLEVTENDVLRISGTRVTLDTIIGAYNDGISPQTIADQYPSVALGDIFAVIAYYLHDKPRIDAYLESYRQRGAAIQKEVEARFNPSGVRERLLSRRTNSHSE